MATELEAKIKLSTEEVSEIQNKLNLINSRSYRVIEINRYYDNGKNRLTKSGQALRIRAVHDSKSKELMNVKITHKGPLQKTELKSREEIEIAVDASPAETEKIFSAMGYVPTFTFQKHRQEWRIDLPHSVTSWDSTSLQVCIDEVPLLGYFLEVEGPNEESIRDLLKKLGLDGRKTIKDGYPKLLKKHLDKLNDKRTEVRFA